MQRLAPRVSVIGWSLWLLVSIVLALKHRSEPSTIEGTLRSMVDLGVKAGGIALSALLCRRPRRALAFMLAALCLFAFWRYYIGGILFHMHPQLGGLTFAESVADWWQQSTRSIMQFITVIPFFVFDTVSLVFWPFYALLFGEESHDNKV